MLDLYYITYTQDRILIKITGSSRYYPSLIYTRLTEDIHTVYGLFIVETFQTVVVVKMAWAWLVAGWGRQVALTELNWGYNFIPITGGIGMSSRPKLVYTLILTKGRSLLVGAVVLYMAHLCPRERIACMEGHSRPHHGGTLLSFYVVYCT